MKKALLTMVVAVMATVNVSAQLKSRYDTENYKRGVELVEEGKLDEGVNLLEAELKEHPKNALGQFYITTAYMELKQYEKAMSSIDKALKYMPKRCKEMRGIAHALKATILSGFSEWEKAVEQLTICLSVLPKEKYKDRAVAHMQRAKLYNKLGLYELAEQDFKKAEELITLVETE